MGFKELKGLEKIKGLAFVDFKKSESVCFQHTGFIHTVFMKFPILVIWENEGEFVYSTILSPWIPSFKPVKKFNKVYEIPLTEKKAMDLKKEQFLRKISAGLD